MDDRILSLYIAQNNLDVYKASNRLTSNVFLCFLGVKFFDFILVKKSSISILMILDKYL